MRCAPRAGNDPALKQAAEELAAKKALRQSGKFIPWQVVTITVDGRLTEE